MEKKFNLTAALERENEIKGRLLEIATAMETENREMTDAEKAENKALLRELDITEMKIAASRQNPMEEREEQKPVEAQFRELLQEVKENKQAREITFATDVKASGAINLNIKSLIPTLNEGLGLPKGLSIVTGVEGDVLYPYGIDDAEMEEVGENVALTDQNLHFENIKVAPGRTGLTITVSNTAIDNAAFDLMGYVQQKFTLALKKFLALKTYSQAAFTGITGPFNSMASSGTITLGTDNAYSKILEAVAAFTSKGFDSDQVCICMSANTEAKLKATLKSPGVAGYVIENGKCAGYDYVVSHYVNTKLKGGSGDDKNDIVATSDNSIYIGFFNYLAVQQHGKVRMTIDSTSKAVGIKNETAITLNTAWSITDLSKKLNGNKTGGQYVTQAFARYVIA